MKRVDFRSSECSRRREQGSALLFGLMMLIALSLIGVSAMSGSIMQERMAGGTRSILLAEEGAEAALREGERFLWDYVEAFGTHPETGDGIVIDNATNGGVLAATFRSSQSWSTDGQEYVVQDLTSVGHGGSLAESPRYIVEGSMGQDFLPDETSTGAQGNQGKLYFYRVSARSTGGSDTVTRLVESYYTVSH